MSQRIRSADHRRRYWRRWRASGLAMSSLRHTSCSACRNLLVPALAETDKDQSRRPRKVVDTTNQKVFDDANRRARKVFEEALCVWHAPSRPWKPDTDRAATDSHGQRNPGGRRALIPSPVHAIRTRIAVPGLPRYLADAPVPCSTPICRRRIQPCGIQPNVKENTRRCDCGIRSTSRCSRSSRLSNRVYWRLPSTVTGACGLPSTVNFTVTG